jgi:hypothetical protein|tara:strand:- start:2826 stop:3260 length:435 start_codon:yes stop_codon:yes gene_type:complete
MSYKGKFRPSKPKKYKGDPTNIVYRSLWELKFMRYCDSNKNVVKWSSEEIVIPYKSPLDNRFHRYFPDFYLKYKDVEGKMIEKVIEIKPAAQVKEPKIQKRKTKKYVTEVVNYAKNQAKWMAAEEFCKDRRWKFQILTEKELGI